MTLEGLADLIRANSANTNGRIDRVVDQTGDLRDHVGDLHALTDRVVDHVGDLHALTDRVVDHVGDLHAHLDRAQNESNATLMNIQNDLTDVRGDVREFRRDMAEVRQSLDLASTVAAMRREIDTLVAEVADLKRRAS